LEREASGRAGIWIAVGRRPELVGGGLIRSLGGWSEVFAIRARGERQISDQRVLGDGEFVQQVLSEMDEQSKQNLRIGRKGIDLSALSKKVCNVEGVSVRELRSGSRRREIVNARGVFSWLAVKELGYTGAEVARFLGVTTSCITRGVSSGKEPKTKKYL
jgi:putative transposase